MVDRHNSGGPPNMGNRLLIDRKPRVAPDEVPPAGGPQRWPVREGAATVILPGQRPGHPENSPVPPAPPPPPSGPTPKSYTIAGSRRIPQEEDEEILERERRRRHPLEPSHGREDGAVVGPPRDGHNDFGMGNDGKAPTTINSIQPPEGAQDAPDHPKPRAAPTGTLKTNTGPVAAPVAAPKAANGSPLMRTLRNNPALIKYLFGAVVALGVFLGVIPNIEDVEMERIVGILTVTIITVLGVSARDSSYGPVSHSESVTRMLNTSVETADKEKDR